MLGILSPTHVASGYLWLALVLGLSASHAYVYVQGRTAGQEKVRAQVETRRDTILQTRLLAEQAAAKAIAEIEVKNQTIRQVVQREIVEKPVYRDCQHSADVLRAINAAITGGDWADTAPGGQLSRGDAARRQLDGRDDGEAHLVRHAVPAVPRSDRD